MWISGDVCRLAGTLGNKTDLVFIDDPALVFIVPAMVTGALLDDLVDGQMLHAGGLRQ